jgi:hypothetical protein
MTRGRYNPKRELTAASGVIITGSQTTSEYDVGTKDEVQSS